VRDDFVAVSDAHLNNLMHRGVRLIGSGGVNTSADTATLRSDLKREALAAFACYFTELAHDMTKGWIDLYSLCCLRYVFGAFDRADVLNEYALFQPRCPCSSMSLGSQAVCAITAFQRERKKSGSCMAYPLRVASTYFE